MNGVLKVSPLNDRVQYFNGLSGGSDVLQGKVKRYD